MADASCCAQDGWTALLQASWNGHDECVRMLRLAGATVQSASEQTAGTAPYLEARYSTPLPRLGQRPLSPPSRDAHTHTTAARPSAIAERCNLTSCEQHWSGGLLFYYDS